jgi:phage N-6-adenine-methyltransferase
MKQEFVTMHGNEWETPSDLFKKIDREFKFTHDLACTEKNKKVSRGIYDSMGVDWHTLGNGWMWLNPPYSPLKPWIQKAQQENKRGCRIVMLVPPIISTRYFSKWVPSEIRFLLGRVPFLKDGVPMKSNTKDSCLLVFGNNNAGNISYWDWKKD